MRERRTIAGALATAMLAAAGPSYGQEEGLALNRFNPSHAGDRMFGSPGPTSIGDPNVHVMLLGDYARNPLVIVRAEDGDEEEVGAVVSDQLFLHLNGTVAIFDRLSFNLDLPVALLQSGDDPTAEGATFASPDSASFGDVRLGARGAILGEADGPVQLGIGGYLWLPSGGDDSFTGNGTVRGMPYLTGGGLAGPVVWSVFAGPEIRDSGAFGGVDQGTMLHFGGGFGVLFGPDEQFQIGPELYAALTVDDVQRRTTNAEILADFRWRPVEFIETGIGIGPGIAAGVGTPDLRGVLMVAYSPKLERDRDGDGIYDGDDACPDTYGIATNDPATNGCPPPSDRDGDNIIDDEDACPDEPGVPSDDPAKHGCPPPPPDRDGDGIIDDEDACPDEPGVPSDDPAKNGCPPPPEDRDGDGIVDTEDACPVEPGEAHEDPKQHGCPDTDGDTFRDPVDACPREKGVADPDPDKHGCPKAVRVTEDQIVILQRVEFETAKAVIKPVSGPLLDEVAQVMVDHPEIRVVEVQGHTDSRGSDQYNKVLSDQRAKAVRQALIERGIDPSRLTGNGYGEEKPIADNDTDVGRQQNRRVEFRIVERDKEEKKE